MNKDRLEALAWKLEHLCTLIEACAECDHTDLEAEVVELEQLIAGIEPVIDRLEKAGEGDAVADGWRM